MIVLDGGMRPLSWTAGARAWIDVLPAAQIYAALGMLPAMMYPVATLARSRNDANGSRALERAVDGRWVMIEAAALEGRGNGEIAVTLRDATAGETFDRLCRTYALTRRERQVVTGARGRPRHARGRRAPLHLPPHRSGSPQVRLREDRRQQPTRARREVRHVGERNVVFLWPKGRNHGYSGPARRGLA